MGSDRARDLGMAAGEAETRLNHVRRAMEEAGLDVLIVSDPCNMFYICGYEAWSFYVQQYLIVSARHTHPIWLGREQDAAGARMTTWLSDDAIHWYGDDYVQSATRHPGTVLAQTLDGLGHASDRIGLEASSFYLTAKTWHVLEDALPNARLVDASLLVNRIRLRKSASELAHMRDAAGIVQSAMTAAYARLSAGVRQCDVAAAIYHALITGTPSAGGQYASSPPFMPAGDRIGTPHLSWTDAPYETGQQVNLELVAARHRYHVPLARTAFIGPVPAKVSDLAKVAIEALDAALAAVRPDARACDVEAAWQRVMRRHGIHKNSRCGYSIGIAYPPTFGEQTISLRPEDDSVLDEGMTFHLMPGVWHGESSIVITEPFVVTANGVETFCDYPRAVFSAS